MLIPMRVDYGVRMLVYLAMHSGEGYIPTSEIAKKQHIPEPYLLRISADLVRAGLVESRRGPGGGQRLAKDPADITVGNVIQCVDHSFAALDCIESPDSCLISNACSQRELWSDVEKMLQDYLLGIRIDDLVMKQRQLEGEAKLTLHPIDATASS